MQVNMVFGADPPRFGMITGVTSIVRCIESATKRTCSLFRSDRLAGEICVCLWHDLDALQAGMIQSAPHGGHDHISIDADQMAQLQPRPGAKWH